MNTGLLASRLMAYAADGAQIEKELLQNIDYERLYKFAKTHSVVNIICYALKQLDKLPPEYAAPFERELKLGRAREATQEIEMQELKQELEKRGIKHMVLKGSVMKHLYPRPDLRSMCDVDIQYDTAHKHELDGFMTERGYELSEVSGTDGVNIAYKRVPFMYIEYHGALMDTDVPLYNAYFGTNFERTVPVQGCEVKYTDEDFFVFMAAHLAKHYFIGGSGVRSLLDIWLYMRKKPELDKEYIFGELKKIRLDEFINIMFEITSVLFDGAEMKPGLENVIEYIFSSGTYGTVSNKAAETVKEEGKLKYLFRRFFPGRDFMAINYPIVKKCILLLPLMWLVRLVTVFFKKGYKGSDVDTVMNVTAAQTDARKIPGNPKG